MESAQMIPLYTTALADQVDKIGDAFQMIVKKSKLGDELDAGKERKESRVKPSELFYLGLDECLAIDVATENIISGGEALIRVSQELKIR